MSLMDRALWIAERRRITEQRMDSLFAPDYDAHWGEISPHDEPARTARRFGD